jgi:hypothetical protein
MTIKSARAVLCKIVRGEEIGELLLKYFRNFAT